GGQIGKTKLFKAFWLAHLFYAKTAPGYLTDWPIVRMPKGPGIHRADRLIDDLIDEKKVTREYEARGPFTEIVCRLTGDHTGSQLSQLSDPAVAAIRSAVGYVQGHTAESISNLSHEFSRSWNNTPDGGELQIYTDLIPDDVYDERCKDLADMKK